MHKRLFSYGMFIYAVGFVAALALNVDLFDFGADRPVASKANRLATADPKPVDPCAAATAVQVVAADIASPAKAERLVAAPCAAKTPTEIIAPQINVLPPPIEPASLEVPKEL